MSLHPEPLGDIPEDTVRVARAAFPKGNAIMQLRDACGLLYADSDFAHLFPKRGQPAWSPWRLALITVFQFLESLSDREAADAVRGRLDWKYTLGLELTDPGFDHSVLSEFRTRLAQDQNHLLLLDTMLVRFKEQGLLRARGRQRTDSTHVLSSVRTLTRHELLVETLRAALNSLAAVAPEWLTHLASPDWATRYGRRIEELRLPKSKTERAAFILQSGQDGFRLLDALDQHDIHTALRTLPAVNTLRTAWRQHFERQGETVRLKEAGELVSTSERFNSPYDPEAHYGHKGTRVWNGYKVHLTETCDDDTPHLITHVHTTPAAQADIEAMKPVHDALDDKNLLPREHLVDTGYVSTALLVAEPLRLGIRMIGPIRHTPNGRAKVPGGFTTDDFTVNWDRCTVTCPQGHESSEWKALQRRREPLVFHARFHRQTCLACPVRARCTQNLSGAPRNVSVLPQTLYEARRTQRKEQSTLRWQQEYLCRAGIEGTISQGVRACGLRRTRYRGQRKTALQEVCVAAAINVQRIASWFMGVPRATTRTSQLTALLA